MSDEELEPIPLEDLTEEGEKWKNIMLESLELQDAAQDILPPVQAEKIATILHATQKKVMLVFQTRDVICGLSLSAEQARDLTEILEADYTKISEDS